MDGNDPNSDGLVHAQRLQLLSPQDDVGSLIGLFDFDARKIALAATSPKKTRQSWTGDHPRVNKRRPDSRASCAIAVCGGRRPSMVCGLSGHGRGE